MDLYVIEWGEDPYQENYPNTSTSCGENLAVLVKSYNYSLKQTAITHYRIHHFKMTKTEQGVPVLVFQQTVKNSRVTKPPRFINKKPVKEVPKAKPTQPFWMGPPKDFNLPSIDDIVQDF